MSIGYRELAAALRRQLEVGVWAPGSTMPKQDELAERFGVNIKTVRSAIQLLESEGLVTAVRRRGTVVRQRPPKRQLETGRYGRSRWKFGNGARAHSDGEGSDESTELTQPAHRVGATEPVAEALGVQVGDPVYERALLVREKGAPTHVLVSYYRPEDIDGTPLVDPMPAPASHDNAFAVLTLQGLEPREITEVLYARMPTPEEAGKLELPSGEAVMILERTIRTEDGRSVEYLQGVYVASRFAWTYTFNVMD